MYENLINEFLKTPFGQEIITSFAKAAATETARLMKDAYQAELAVPLDTVISIDECCEYLKCSQRSFMRNYIENGKYEALPHPNDRRRKVIRKSDWQNILGGKTFLISMKH